MMFVKILKLKIFLLAVLLYGCSSSKGVEAVCNLDVLNKKLPQYEYTGPISLSEATAIYDKDVLPYETPKVKSLWKSFKEISGNDSCIYIFNTSDEDWAMLRGVKGLISIRHGEIIEAFIIKRN